MSNPASRSGDLPSTGTATTGGGGILQAPPSGAGQPVRRGTASRRPSGTGFVRKPGRRPMKEYPLTEGEMRELGAVGALTTLFFAIGTGCLGFVLNVSQNFAFSPGIPKEVFIFWDTLRIEGIIAAIVLYLLGVGGLIYSGLRVRKIKGETEHDE